MGINKKKDFIVCLKILACIMITNSHCREIYPISFFAIGGGFGNAIFFLVSGFLLVNIKDSFVNWYRKRSSRILYSVLAIIIISLCVAEGRYLLEDFNLAEILVFYLNKYWFAFAILLYYPIYYLVFYKPSKSKLTLSMLIYVSIYFVYYFIALDKTQFVVELEGFSLFKVYYYIGIFITGGILKSMYEKIKNIDKNRRKKSIWICVIINVLSIAGWGMIYMLITVFNTAYMVQFLIHVFVFVFGISAMMIAMLLDEKIDMSNKYKILNLFSESTLEIYLIQVTFVYLIVDIVFPINWILFFAIAFVGGILFHVILDRLRGSKN